MNGHENNKVRILNKAFGMLATLNAERGMSVAGLARRLGLPRPTVNRILASLVDEGLVARAPNDGLYCVTVAARELSRRRPIDARLEAAAQPALRQAQNDNPWPLFVTSIVDGHATMVAASESHVHFLPRKAVRGIILTNPSPLAEWLQASPPTPGAIEGSTGPESWAAVRIEVDAPHRACLGMRVPAPLTHARAILQQWVPDLERRADAIALAWRAWNPCAAG